jgi:hypothetical protein
MNGSTASVAYWILPLVVGVIAIGVLAMVARAIRKEDKRFSLYGAAPGTAARATRWLTRVGTAGVPVQPRSRVS